MLNKYWPCHCSLGSQINTVDPLNDTSLNYLGPLLHGFFSMNISRLVIGCKTEDATSDVVDRNGKEKGHLVVLNMCSKQLSWLATAWARENAGIWATGRSWGPGAVTQTKEAGNHCPSWPGRTRPARDNRAANPLSACSLFSVGLHNPPISFLLVYSLLQLNLIYLFYRQ